MERQNHIILNRHSACISSHQHIQSAKLLSRMRTDEVCRDQINLLNYNLYFTLYPSDVAGVCR